MLSLFGILIILSSVILGLIVLIQNPKGGGLSGTFGGMGNQIMGVQQTTDVLEKGTWIFAAVVGILCLISPAFFPKGGADNNKSLLDETSGRTPATQKTAPAAAPAAPGATTPMPGTTAPAAGTESK
jgi:preprotein translocase subunit SecG